MRKVFEKFPIIRYVANSYVKGLLCSLAALAVVFAVLILSGVYPRIESALDLKYNSPFILVPLFGFAALTVVCVFVGFLMYFHKYKRSKTNSVFYKTFSNVLNAEQGNKK